MNRRRFVRRMIFAALAGGFFDDDPFNFDAVFRTSYSDVHVNSVLTDISIAYMDQMSLRQT